MNRFALSIASIAMIVAATSSVDAVARGAGHISTGAAPVGGFTLGAPQIGAGTSAPKATASDIKASHVHGYDINGSSSGPQNGSTQSGAGATASQNGSSGGTTMSSLVDKAEARGIVLGVGNSLGSADSLRGKGISAGNHDVSRISRHLSKTSVAGAKSANGSKSATGANSQKPQATVLGVSRAPSTGDVCIWGAGSDGSCH